VHNQRIICFNYIKSIQHFNIKLEDPAFNKQIKHLLPHWDHRLTTAFLKAKNKNNSLFKGYKKLSKSHANPNSLALHTFIYPLHATVFFVCLFFFNSNSDRIYFKSSTNFIRYHNISYKKKEEAKMLIVPIKVSVLIKCWGLKFCTGLKNILSFL